MYRRGRPQRSKNHKSTEQVKTQMVFKSQRLSSMFNIKDKTKKEHENNVVYKIKCPDENCTETYIGETERRVFERVMDHGGRDKKFRCF